MLVLRWIIKHHSALLSISKADFSHALQLAFVVCAIIGGVVLYKVFQGSSVEGAIRDTKGSIKGGFKEAKGSARVKLRALVLLQCLLQRLLMCKVCAGHNQ